MHLSPPWLGGSISVLLSGAILLPFSYLKRFGCEKEIKSVILIEKEN
jgi:hypothetical protein